MIDRRNIGVALAFSGLLLAPQPAAQQVGQNKPADAKSPANTSAASGPRSPQGKGLSI